MSNVQYCCLTSDHKALTCDAGDVTNATTSSMRRRTFNVDAPSGRRPTCHRMSDYMSFGKFALGHIPGSSCRAPTMVVGVASLAGVHGDGPCGEAPTLDAEVSIQRHRMIGCACGKVM